MATRDQADPYLNPSPEENRTPEFGRDSRGYDKNLSFEGRSAGKGELFAGIGDLLGLKVKVEDNFFKNRIDEEVTQAVDLQRDAEILSLGGTSPNVNREAVPPLLVQELKKADSLTAAKRAGSVRDPYYWNRMDVIARETRQRYPGHREYIDQKISSMLGTTPANALVRELQARGNAGASAADKDAQHWERVILERTELGPAYMAAKAKGTPWSLDTMKFEATQYLGQKLNLESETKRLAHEEQQGKAVENEAERVGRDRVNFVMKNTLKPFIGPDSEFGKLTETLRTTAQRGELTNPQDEARARGLLIQMRQMGLQAIETEGDRVIERPDGTKTTLKGMMGQEKWNNVVRLATSQFAALEDAYNNKDYNLLSHNLAYVTSVTNTAKGRLLTQNQHALLYNTLREVLGPQGADRYFGQDPQQFGDFVKSTQGEALLKMFEGLTPAKNVQAEFEKVVGTKNPEAIQSQIDTVVRTIKDPTTPDEAVRRLGTSFFGPGNKGHIASMDAAGQHNMYLKMTDPGVAKRIYDLRGQYPQLWQNYQAWSADTFIALNNTDLNSARAIITDRRNIELGWDPTTQQFRLNTIVPQWDTALNATQAYIAQDLERSLQSGAKEVVDRLNKSIEGIKTQFILENKDPAKEIPMLLKRRINFDMAAGKTGTGPENFFLMMNGLLDKVLGPIPTETREQYDKRIGDKQIIWSPGRSNYRLPGEMRAGLSDLALEEQTRMLADEVRAAADDLEAEGGGGVGRFARQLPGASEAPRGPFVTDASGDLLYEFAPGVARSFGDTTAAERQAAEREEADEVERGLVAESRGKLLPPRLLRQGSRSNLGGPEVDFSGKSPEEIESLGRTIAAINRMDPGYKPGDRESTNVEIRDVPTWNQIMSMKDENVKRFFKGFMQGLEDFAKDMTRGKKK